MTALLFAWLAVIRRALRNSPVAVTFGLVVGGARSSVAKVSSDASIRALHNAVEVRIDAARRIRGSVVALASIVTAIVVIIGIIVVVVLVAISGERWQKSVRLTITTKMRCGVKWSSRARNEPEAKRNTASKRYAFPFIFFFEAIFWLVGLQLAKKVAQG